MDVKCERCNTEYEFDDALVSGRGTTVKCTNCGHKFKIRRGDGDVGEDVWNVITGDGRTLVFTSLRELQRAIEGYLVERNDRLSRGGLPPKAIGQIPELAPFFEQREAAKKAQQPARPQKTQDGLGPHEREPLSSGASGRTNPGNPAPPPPAAVARPRMPTKPEFPAPPSSGNIAAAASPIMGGGKSTLIGTGPVSEEEAFSAASAAASPARGRPPSVPAPPAARDPEPPPPNRAPPSVTKQPAEVPRTPGISPPAEPAVRLRRDSQHTAPMQRPGLAGGPLVTPASIPRMDKLPNVPAAVPPSNKPPLPERARSRQPTPPPAPAASRSQGPLSPPPPPATRPTPAPVLPRTVPAAVVPTAAAEAVAPVAPFPHVRRSLLSEIDVGEREPRRERGRGRGSYESIPELPEPRRRRSVGGFIVSAAVIGGVLLLSAIWAQKNLHSFGTKPVVTAPAVDPRVATFLGNGEKALADGNLELAKESFDKASALSEKDPHVLLGLARLAAVRADVPWLRSRLLSAEATDENRITRDALAEQGATARKAADDALAVAPEDPAAIRAKIDALRITGDRDGARGLVGKIAASATQPESAYVLAALDLAETSPLWPTVIERLKTAASAETGPGRARAALVFALARSGDAVAAKAEVERLSAMTKPHPLLPLLRAFADRAKAPTTKVDGGAEPAGSAASATTQGNPKAPGGGGGGGGGGGEGVPTGDARSLVAQAERARAKGDYERARTLFNAAAEKNPSDSEALNGLAAVSYAQHDLAGARAAYKRVLSINPNYMPALVGLADVEWDSGDRATATRMYKDIIDRYPEGAYPGRIKTRSEGGGG